MSDKQEKIFNDIMKQTNLGYLTHVFNEQDKKDLIISTYQLMEDNKVTDLTYLNAADKSYGIIDNLTTQYSKLTSGNKIMAFLIAIALGVTGTFLLSKLAREFEPCLEPCDNFYTVYVMPILGAMLGVAALTSYHKFKVKFLLLFGTSLVKRLVGSSSAKLAALCLLLCKEQSVLNNIKHGERSEKSKNIERLNKIKEKISLLKVDIQSNIKKLKIQGKNKEANQIENAYNKLLERKFVEAR